MPRAPNAQRFLKAASGPAQRAFHSLCAIQQLSPVIHKRVLAPLVGEVPGQAKASFRTLAELVRVIQQIMVHLRHAGVRREDHPLPQILSAH